MVISNETYETPYMSQSKKNSIATFKDALKFFVIKKNNQSMTSQVNRNIGALLSYSVKTGRTTDFERALKFPLSPVILSIVNGDGSCRSKSKLMDIINPKENENCAQALS